MTLVVEKDKSFDPMNIAFPRSSDCSAACGSLAALDRAAWVSAAMMTRWPLALSGSQRFGLDLVGKFWRFPCCFLQQAEIVQDVERNSIVQGSMGAIRPRIPKLPCTGS